MEESILNYTTEVIHKSGGIGVLTVFLLFVFLGVFVERLIFWSRACGIGWMLGLISSSENWLRNTEELLRRGKVKEASILARSAPHTALSVLAEALAKVPEPGSWSAVREYVVGQRLAGNVEMGRRFMMICIQAFALLGMLGTCHGLYLQLSSFGATATNPNSLEIAMAGMGKAFTTTLVGLGAAAIGTLLYFLNELWVGRFKRELLCFDRRIETAMKEATNPESMIPGHNARVASEDVHKPVLHGAKLWQESQKK